MNKERLKNNLCHLKEITEASDRTGWMVDDVGFFIYSLIKFYKPQLVLQIGHLWGKSACVILEALNDNFLTLEDTLEQGKLSGDNAFYNFTKSNSPKSCQNQKLISVDAFPYGNWEEGIIFLKDQYDNFEYIVDKSDSFFKQHGSEIKEEYGDEIILGIVDGNHAYEGCYNDLVNMSKIRANIIIVDDTCWIPELNKAAENFSDKFKYNYLNHNIYNGIGILTRFN